VPPETRARFAHSIIAEILSLPQEKGAAIRQRCGPAWQQIVQAPPVSWLDEATYNALTQAIRSQLGDGGMIKLYRGMGRRFLDNPNVQSFAESAIRLLGMSPHTLLKASPRGRDSLVRGCGTLQYEYVSHNSAKLHLRNFPASTFRSGTTVVLLSGTFLGLLDAAGVSRTARLETTGVDLESGHATFVLHW